MVKKNYKLKGHESFMIRDGWLTKGMVAVSKNKRLYRNNAGADALGVGTNMAKSIRYWMKAAKLVFDSPSQGVSLTKLGETIFKYDCYLEDAFSLWIIHANIATNYELATSWYLFFNHINVTSTFTREELLVMLKDQIIESTGELEPSERSIKDDCGVLLQMYSSANAKDADPEDKNISPFESLGLVQRVSGKYLKKRPQIDQIDSLVILYLIIDKLNSDGSIQIDYISDGDNMPGKILNLNRIAVNYFLDDLQRKKYITVNRTAGLDIIYPDKCKDIQKEDLLRCYFERNSPI